ncbi:hypothetical protein SDC9_105051 [bioreactor metagenome]|uniref:Uncharacterized protein n=1 Tax=bioreactor metagenome TaxID=1076179 RepID=A0A645AYH8_9ZZZZ
MLRIFYSIIYGRNSFVQQLRLVGTDPQHRHIKHPYPILDPFINHIGGIHIVHKIFTYKQADTFKIGTAVVEVKHV